MNDSCHILSHPVTQIYQRVAVRCSALQCVAVRCSALQCVAVRCSVLQRVAVCCSVLQCVAVCCNTLEKPHCAILKWLSHLMTQLYQYVAVCCSVLQCVAVCCSVLHHLREASVRHPEVALTSHDSTVSNTISPSHPPATQ